MDGHQFQPKDCEISRVCERMSYEEPIPLLYLFTSSNSFSTDNDVALCRMHLQLLSSPTQFFRKFCQETPVWFKRNKNGQNAGWYK